jgi:hypothetical protein
MAALSGSLQVRAPDSGRTNRLVSYWIAGFLAVLTAGACIYYRMFTGFSRWDDDGYLLIGIRSLLNGHRLYDDVYSQYGPFYYLAYGAAYSLLGQPVSHDAQRFLGVALWLLSAILWARTVYLLTRSPLWSGFGFFLAVRLLGFFPWSAGHPEEICMSLLSAIVVLVCGLRPVGARRKVVALACLVAAIALTKVNLGLYVAVAIGLVLLKASSPTPPQRFAEISLSFAGLVLPIALMSPMWQFAWARNYALVATASIGAAILIARTVEPVLDLTGRIWRPAVLSFTACTALIILPFCLGGTTLKALIYMTVLQHVGLARNWYLAAPIDSETLLWTAASLSVVAIAYMQSRGVRSRGPRAAAIGTPIAPVRPDRLNLARIRTLPASVWVDSGVLVLKAIVGLTCLCVVQERWSIPPYLFKYCVPFAWLVLVLPTDETSHETRLGRIALCFLSVFVYLYAFPVAGAQVLFANLPAGILSVVLLRDATLGIANSIPAALPSRRFLRFGSLMGFALIVGLFSRELRDAYLSYRKGVSLGMPGATRVRVRPQESAAYRWIIGNVTSCSAFYSMPGLFSLYFWTAQEPPTNLTMSNWIGLLTASQQNAVVRDLSRHQGMCVVYNPALVEFWRRGQDLSRSPIAQYIHSEFVPVAESDGYFIMKRKTATPLE